MIVLPVFSFGAPRSTANTGDAQGWKPYPASSGGGVTPLAKTIPAVASGNADLVAIAGQSNAVGQSSGATGLPSGWAVSSRVQMWNGSAFANYDPANASSWGPEVNFAQSWLNDAQNTGRNLYLVKTASGGTQLGAISMYGYGPQSSAGKTDWYPDTSGGFYSQLKTAVTGAKAALVGASLDSRLKGILWIQGESDSAGTTLAASRAANFSYFVTKFRAEIGDANSVFIEGRISPDPVWVYRSQVRYADAAYIASDPMAVMIDTDDATRYAPGVGAGTVHYDATGLNLIGGRAHSAFRAAYAPTTFTMSAPTLSAIAANAPVGTVLGTLTVTGGTINPSFGLSGCAGLDVTTTGVIKVLDPTLLVAGSYTLTATASNGLSTVSLTIPVTVTASGILPNLLSQSEQVADAPWSLSFVTLLANGLLAPDGTTTADKLTQTASGALGYRTNQTISATGGEVYTFSCYMQKAGSNYGALAMYDGSITCAVVFDLNAGAVIGVSNSSGFLVPVGYSITAASNGFYRCSISCVTRPGATSITAQAFVKGTSALGVAETGSTANSAWVWGGQINGGFQPVTYQKTQSTNLLLYSEQLDQTPWAASNVTVVANGTSAPDSTTTAEVVAQTTGTINHRVQQPVNASGGVQYTFSCYLRKDGSNYAALAVSDGVNVFAGSFDLNAGTYLGDYTTPPSGHSIAADLNGYYRCSITATLTAGATVATPQVVVKSTNGTALSEAGVVTNTTDMWGAQLTYGSSPAAYTKTTTAPV